MKALRLPSHLAAALLLAAAFVVGAWWAATPAAAHDQLISSTPADGGTLTELPTQIVLEFNNELIDAAPALLIRDAANTTIHRATPEVDGRFATTAFPELGDGSYRIAWSVVSSDGHRIEGSMPFEMATGRAAAPLASPGAASTGAASTGAASTGADSGPDDDVASVSATAAEEAGLAGLPAAARVAIGIGGVGAVAAVAAVVVLRARRGGLR